MVPSVVLKDPLLTAFAISDPSRAHRRSVPLPRREARIPVRGLAALLDLLGFRSSPILPYRWKESTAVNTIHSLDFSSAAVAIAEWAAKNGSAAVLSQASEDLPTTLTSNELIKDVAGAAKKEEKIRAAVFSVVDDGETTQKEIAKVIEEVVGVEAGFHGSIISSFAKLNMGDVLEDVNDKVSLLSKRVDHGYRSLPLFASLQHLEGWSALLTASNPPISTTVPISPNTVR